MEKIYIFGHKKPDTDSVSAAISLSYLKNQLGLKTEPAVLGDINQETKYVLDYFKVKEPKYLNNVRLQIKDVNYHRGYYINEEASVLEVYQYMTKNSVTGIPLVDGQQKLTGLITEKMLVKELVEGDFTHLYTTYKNIAITLEAEEVICFDHEITGLISVASYRSTTFLNNIELNESSILIVGDRHSIIEYAVNSGVKMIIVVGNGEIKAHHLEIAKEKRVNIIRTSFDTFHTTKLIGLSNYVKCITTTKEPISIEEVAAYDDFLEMSRKLRHNNYPVINKEGKCLGLIRVTDITERNKKKVILVDHNEKDQSVDNLEEAEIIEIVDHHRIGDLTTKSPINFRNMAVGSTNTIIYFLYRENNRKIPKDMAGLMMSGILSDTLALTSPTTTELDKIVIKELELITELDANNYAMEMLKARTSFVGKTKEEIIQMDFKIFSIADKKIAITQVITFNIEEILNEQEQYLELLEKLIIKNSYEAVILAVTDILKEGSYILYTKNMEEIIKEGFSLPEIKEGFFLPGCVSRKKQIVPIIMEAMEVR